MPYEAQGLLDRLGRALMASSPAMVRAHILLPCTLNIGGSSWSVRTGADLDDLIGAVCAEVISRGVERLHPRLVAMDMPRDGHFRMWANWDAVLGDTVQTEMLRTVLTCHPGTDGPAISDLRVERLQLRVAEMPLMAGATRH